MKVEVVKYNNKEYFERTLNSILENNARDIEDIKFQVVKNFLPETRRGEYEEIFYAFIIYR